MVTKSLFSSVNFNKISVNFFSLFSKTSILSLINKEFELSTMSLEVAPKCTYSPASPSHCSASPLVNAAMSCFV